MSARIQDFDISEVDMPDHGIVNVKAIKDADGQQLLIHSEGVQNVHKTYFRKECHEDVQSVIACQMNSEEVQSHPLCQFNERSVTPSLSSESFYYRVEPVKLFNSPITPTSKSDDAVFSVDSNTPSSLGLGSLFSPNDFFLSPTDVLTNTENESALLLELESLLHSEAGFLTPGDLDFHCPAEILAADGDRCMQSRSKSFGFQVRSEPLSSLISYSDSEAEGNNRKEDGCNIVNGRQKMARQLNFQAPSILCKRKRHILQQRDSIKTRIDESSFDLDEVSDFVKNEMPASPPEMPLFKIDDPFTPSRFLNNPEMVTSTPLCSKVSLTSQEELNSRKHCVSPPIKRLLWSDLQRTPTPFKMSVDDGEWKPCDFVKDEVDEGDVTQLPFSSFRVVDAENPQCSIFNTEAVEKNVTGCQMTLTESLKKPWTNAGCIDGIALVGSLVSLETPSKSLIDDKSLMFSPPWIAHDTLHEVMSFDQSAPSCMSRRMTKAVRDFSKKMNVEDPSDYWMTVGWERVACGQTLTQMELIKQAKELLDNGRCCFRPRSLML